MDRRKRDPAGLSRAVLGGALLCCYATLVRPRMRRSGATRDELAAHYPGDELIPGGRPSAERIHPEWQALAEGDRILAVPDGSVWFDVAVLQPQRTLVLRSSLTLPRARHFDPNGPPPGAFSDSTWAFHLRPLGEHATRLVVRGVERGRPAWLTRLADWIFWEPAHWVMQRRQFAGLSRRAAAQPGSARTR